MPEQSQPLDTWAIVEVMGHKKFAGYVTEQTFGGAALIRVDVPETEQEVRTADGPAKRTTQAYSKLIGVGSIYCITPCTEAVARLAATALERWNDPIPVDMPKPLQIPASVGAPASDADVVDDDDEDFDDDYGYHPNEM
jgi:hypothetical protein